MDKSQFIEEISNFIEKEKNLELKNELTCDNIFKNSDLYIQEKKLLNQIAAGLFKTTKEQGDALEAVIKSLFKRINLIHNVEVTTKETAIGQIDIVLIPLRENIYDVLGLSFEKPKGLIGECKNYIKNKVSRPEIEKSCWRACKGGCLSFFIGVGYTDDAITEISEYNINKEYLCTKHTGAYIVPLSIDMIQEIVNNDINFCYFIKWAINVSKNITAISSYLQRFE